MMVRAPSHHLYRNYIHRGMGAPPGAVQASGGYYLNGTFYATPQPAVAPLDTSNPIALTQGVLSGNPQALQAQQAYNAAYASTPQSQRPLLIQGGSDPYLTYLASLQNPGGAQSINSNIIAGSGVPVQSAVTLPSFSQLGITAPSAPAPQPPAMPPISLLPQPPATQSNGANQQSAAPPAPGANQSNAPNAAPVVPPDFFSTLFNFVTGKQPATPSGGSVATSCWQLFSPSEPCIGPIGLWTLGGLGLGAALLFSMAGKRGR